MHDHALKSMSSAVFTVLTKTADGILMTSDLLNMNANITLGLVGSKISLQSTSLRAAASVVAY